MAGKEYGTLPSYMFLLFISFQKRKVVSCKLIFPSFVVERYVGQEKDPNFSPSTFVLNTLNNKIKIFTWKIKQD
jgi:hypothetical protein